MKVNIGPYVSWVGPYQIAELLKYIGIPKQTYESIGEFLSKTFVNSICKKIYQFRKRKEYVRIDNYDVWSMDVTLSKVILPMLKKLKEVKHGSPHIDDKDVPKNLRSTSAKPLENNWDTDEFFHKRWEYVLDEMIYAFEHISSADDIEYTRKAHIERMNKGLILFGKYYRALWD